VNLHARIASGIDALLQRSLKAAAFESAYRHAHPFLACWRRFNVNLAQGLLV
jgi:hypothetical protein